MVNIIMINNFTRKSVSSGETAKNYPGEPIFGDQCVITSALANFNLVKYSKVLTRGRSHTDLHPPAEVKICAKPSTKLESSSLNPWVLKFLNFLSFWMPLSSWNVYSWIFTSCSILEFQCGDKLEQKIWDFRFRKTRITRFLLNCAGSIEFVFFQYGFKKKELLRY